MTRIGLIGCGRWGVRILSSLDRIGASVQVVEPSGPPNREVGRDHRWVGSVAELQPVDAYVVATPATSHREVIDSIWHQDVPVFCEKPLTTSVDDARHLARRDDGRLHVMHIWRYHGGIEILGELARTGRLGAVHGVHTVRVNWTSPRTDTDAVWTLVPHDVSIAIDILDTAPKPTSARAELDGEGHPVGLYAIAGEQPDPWLIIEASTRSHQKRRDVRVHGDDAVASLDGVAGDHVVVARGGGTEPSIEYVPFDPTPPLDRELAAFVAFVDGGPPPRSGAGEGLEVVEYIVRLRALAGLRP